MADRLHLQPKHREVLETLLREHLPNVEVWAYGSRVSGKSHDGSDLDLVLRGPGLQEIPIGQLGDFEEAVRESIIPFLVEARDWSRLPKSFHQEIERTHVVLSDSSERCAGSSWDEGTLADACRAIDYGLTASATINKTGSKFLRITDIVSGSIDWNTVPYVVADAQTTRKYRLHDDDIVIARTGASTGCSSYIKSPPPSVFASYLVRLQPKPKFDGRFLSYYLKSDMFWAYIRGVLGDKSAQPNASASTMTQAPLTFPRDIDEQRAIAHILGTLDDRIELNRRMNETLEAMAHALFKSWFVDFDPVRAKLEGRDPGLPKPLADLFPNRLVDSEAGEIPEGWEVSRIGDELNVVGGSTPSTKEPSYWNCGEHNWATPKDLSKISSPVLLETNRKITDAGANKISSGLLPAGTVLLSSRAPIGYIAVAEAPTAINQGFIAMVCNKRLPNLYVLFWCQDNLDHIKGISGGSTFAEISKKAFRPIRVTVPSHEVLSAYQFIARPLFRRLVENVKEVATLAQTRDLLLPKLISGTIRLNDVETYVK